MKLLKRNGAVLSVVCMLLASSCNNAGDNSGNSDMNTSNDTTPSETRRNTTDTVNYLTADSTNKSQDAIDPNPPGR